MRRLISIGSVAIAVIALGLVLYNATLVDRKPPSIVRVSLSATAGGDRVGQSQTAIDIEFSEPVRTATVEPRFHLQPYVAGGFTWDGTTAIFTPSAKLPPGTKFTVSVEPGFEDIAGNAAGTGLDGWAFTTVGPPTVVSSDPADGATGFGVDGGLTLRFDRLMDTASVEAAIRLDPPAATRASWSGDTLHLTFDPPLLFGTSYRLTIGTSAADTGGTHLPAPFATRFTTVAAGLTVLGTTPADGVAGISVRSQIAIRFDAPIDPTTATAAIQITPPVSGDVRVVTIPDDQPAQPGPTPGPESARTLIFTPSAPLGANTTYTVTLAPVVARRGDPSQVAARRTWTFTTGSPSSSGQNQLAFLTARSGTRNVWLMNPDGTNPRQLTTEFVPVSGFDATRDGHEVAYSAGGVVRLISIDGATTTRITPDGAFEYAPRFSADDRWLLVGRRGPDGADLGYWLEPLPGTDGAARRILASGAPALGSAAITGDGIPAPDGTDGWSPRAAFDPTGRWLLLVTSGGESRLVDLAPTDPAASPSPAAVPITANSSPVWSAADGAFLLAGRGPSGDALWTVTTDGRAVKVEGTDGAVGGVSISPAGSAIAPVRTLGAGHASLLVVPIAGRPRTINGPDTFDDRWPDLSPDGATAVIGRTSSASSDAGDGIWLVDVTSGATTQLATDGVYARWIP